MKQIKEHLADKVKKKSVDKIHNAIISHLSCLYCFVCILNQGENGFQFPDFFYGFCPLWFSKFDSAQEYLRTPMQMSLINTRPHSLAIQTEKHNIAFSATTSQTINDYSISNSGTRMTRTYIRGDWYIKDSVPQIYFTRLPC